MPNPMSNFFNKLKGKSSKSSPNDNSVSIQPHPAKTNDPADLEQTPGLGGGLKHDPVGQVYNAKGPYIPSEEIRNSLEQPATREELKARAAELNGQK